MTTCVRTAWLDLDGTGTTTVPLENPAAGYFCSNLDLGSPAVREVVNNRPDRDGVTDRTQYMGSRVVTANITAAAGAGAVIDAAATLFAPYMAPAARPVLHYVLDRPGTPERVLTLRASAYSWPVAGADQRDVQLQWVAADPVCYDPAAQTATAVPGGGPVTIAPVGDTPLRPLLHLVGPVTGPAVALTPAAGLAWMLAFPSGYTVAAGHYVNIDTDARTVLLDGDPAHPLLGAMDWTRSSWQWIQPAPSTTTMTLTGTATSGATQVVATWRAGYLT